MQEEIKEAWKMSKISQEGKRREEKGLLQATVTELQSQPQHRQHTTAPGTPDQAAPAAGGREGKLLSLFSPLVNSPALSSG